MANPGGAVLACILLWTCPRGDVAGGTMLGMLALPQKLGTRRRPTSLWNLALPLSQLPA